MSRSDYGEGKKKPDHVLIKEREQKKLTEDIRNLRNGLKFKQQIEGDNSLVLGFSTRLSLRWKFGKPKQITNIIVIFRKPLDREMVERRIRNAFT